LGIVVGSMTAAGLWEGIEIRAGMLVTVVAVIIAGVALSAYRDVVRPGGTSASSEIANAH
jgi:hypothetical protein